LLTFLRREFAGVTDRLAGIHQELVAAARCKSGPAASLIDLLLQA
jgi:hypothetical protein